MKAHQRFFAPGGALGSVPLPRPRIPSTPQWISLRLLEAYATVFAGTHEQKRLHGQLDRCDVWQVSGGPWEARAIG
jgi:hypothetical protein